MPSKLLLFVDSAELICESWDWEDMYWEFLGGPTSIVGCRRGGGNLSGKGGRVKPKVALGEVRVVVVVVGDSSIGVGVDRDACGCGSYFRSSETSL